MLARAITAVWEFLRSGKLQSHPALQIVAAIALYWFLWNRLFRWCNLPESAYAKPYVVLEALGVERLVKPLLIGAVPILLFARRISWREIDPLFRARGFAMVLTITMAITFGLYDYNYYYDQSHWLDRSLTLVFGLLVWFHPGFLLPFVAMMMVSAFELHHPLPIGMTLWPDKRLPVHLLVLLLSFLYVRILGRSHRQTWLFLVLIFVGAFYAHAGISKMALGPRPWSWVVENETSNILVSSHFNGWWLGNLSDDTVWAASRLLRHLDPLMNAVTLVVEAGAVFYLASRKATYLWLVGFLVMHIAILATTGIFFWKWMVADIALLWILWREYQQASAGQAGTGLLAERWPRVWAVAGTVALSAFVFNQSGILFAWWDNRYENHFSWEVETVSGERYPLNPRFFAPYDIPFVQSSYYAIAREGIIVGTYGVGFSYPWMKKLQRLSVEEVREIQKRRRPQYRHWEAMRYKRFVRRYVTNAMKRDRKEFLPGWLPPPYHFRWADPFETYDYQAKIARVHVTFEARYFTDEGIHLIRKAPVFSVDIAPVGSSP